ncbi:MAG: hypothetical protein KatS3mg031_0829 [Chitinophagales bacterium]|nr:MAG: hypothetical protein KatS3mg031_0829 [Chitinophagales bacterium]
MPSRFVSLFLMVHTVNAFATVWTINNSGNTFRPDSITITEGDTVSFVIANNHNAVEVSQATWNANSTTPLPGGFSVPFGGGIVLPSKLPVGTHWYVCQPHAAIGMKGVIIVQPCTPPSQPGPISGQMGVCAGATVTYRVSPVSGATAYAWELPAGWSGSSTADSITVVAGSTGGTISVTAENNCGSSFAQTFTVNVFTLPEQPSTISGPDSVCAGESVNYSVAPVSGADAYTWTFPAGWSGSSSSSSASVVAGNTGGNIMVTADNACGASVPQVLAVSVVSLDPTFSISGNILTANNTAETFQWLDCGNGFTPLVAETTAVFVVTTTSSYALMVSSAGCRDTSACENVVVSGLDMQRLRSQVTVFLQENGVYQINLPKDGRPGNDVVSLFDIHGRWMYSSDKIRTEEGHILLDISSLPAGIYLVKITGPQRTYTTRIARY